MINRLSKHSKTRNSERLNYDVSTLNKKFYYAKKNGYKLNQLKDPLYTYLFEKQYEGSKTSIRIYENVVYIIDNWKDKLITVYPLPEEYRPIDKYLLNKEENKPCIIIVKDKYVSEGDILSYDIRDAIIFRSIQRAKNYVNNCRILQELNFNGDSIEYLSL